MFSNLKYSQFCLHIQGTKSEGKRNNQIQTLRIWSLVDKAIITQSSCKDDHLNCSIFEPTMYTRICSSSPSMDHKAFLHCSSSTFFQFRNHQNPRSNATKFLFSIFKIRIFVGLFLQWFKLQFLVFICF